MINESQRLAEAQRRLNAMIGDPFGAQILRDLVPKGHKITIALAEERTDDVVRRCLRNSALPTVIAVDELGADALTILAVEEHAPGEVSLSRPGDWRQINAHADATVPLADLIDMMRGAHDDPTTD